MNDNKRKNELKRKKRRSFNLFSPHFLMNHLFKNTKIRANKQEFRTRDKRNKKKNDFGKKKYF